MLTKEEASRLPPGFLRQFMIRRDGWDCHPSLRRHSVKDGRRDAVRDFASIIELTIGFSVGLAAALAKQVRMSRTSGWPQSSYAMRAIQPKNRLRPRGVLDNAETPT